MGQAKKVGASFSASFLTCLVHALTYFENSISSQPANGKERDIMAKSIKGTQTEKNLLAAFGGAWLAMTLSLA
jgi:hypothetical protein